MEGLQTLNIEKPAHQKLLIGELLAVTGISAVAVWGFTRITSRVISNNLEPLRTDVRIMQTLDGQHTPAINRFMKITTEFGSGRVVPLIAGALTFAFFKSKKNKARSYEIPVVSIGCGILNFIFKAKYKRVRPVDHDVKVRGWSYPSGHAMISVSFYGFLIYLLYRTKRSFYFAWPATCFLACLIMTIGISRSYLHAHYPSDVAAGYAIGFTWLVSSVSTTRIAEFVFKKQPELLGAAPEKA